MEELVHRRPEPEPERAADAGRAPEPARTERAVAQRSEGERVRPERGAVRQDPLEHSLTPGERPREAPPREACERYEDLEVLGSGGTGVVTRVRDRRTGEEFALKRLRQQSTALLRRLRREAELIASLDHPGIVRLLRVEGTPEAPALLFELVAGPSLESLVRRQGRLNLVPAVEICLALADALAYAHARGVVHRDVKPSNVILDREGRPKLIDFGLALPVESLASVSLTGAGPCGTLDYMAPEQWRGAHDVDGRADVYSLGATLYRLLTGNSPRVIREGRLPEPAREVVLAAVEEDPGDRYDDMRAFGAALRELRERALRDASGVHTPLERVARRLRDDLAETRARKRARRLVVAASGLSALGLLDLETAHSLGTRLEVGAPLSEVLSLLVDTLTSSGASPRLLGDAHAVLSAALRSDELSEAARGELRRLAAAARAPRRERPSARLARCVERLARRGAIGSDELQALAAHRGAPAQVLEELLVALRAQAEDSLTREEWRAHESRWRHALEELAAALPEEEFAPRIQRERLALDLERLAREAAEDPAE
ncbi:MAG: serine/threonine protein kinase [Planctomycetota bacterium]|nr:MAG: serine/threonine protein kinase [Planctomycetota bacterium]